MAFNKELVFKKKLYNSIQYNHDNGVLVNGDCIEMFKGINSSTIDVIFADPPYNIKKADWDNFESQEAYIKWSIKWIKEASRVLKDNGMLYICGFSEILADLKHPSMKYFDNCKWLVWYYQNKANLGKDWGRSHESLLCFRKSKTFTMNIDDVRIPYSGHTLKYPERAQGETSQFNHGNEKSTWIPNPLGAKPKDVIELPTTCNGMKEKTKHPTQKPEALLRKIIMASSNENEIILDPFSGSGTTCVVSEQLNRNWIGFDMNPEYNSWAINRIQTVQRKTKEEWIKYDKGIETRRESIK